ncbi:MAG TPA: hypothetical protein PLW02_04575, partial [Verrucomicrobiota bacterium]|nr:hypothetical protein [Verrucomicrobiota bacterium]
MSTQINETLIRDIIEEVMQRIGQPNAQKSESNQSGTSSAKKCSACRNKFGVFQDPNEACQAAYESYLQLSEQGVAGRVKIINIVKEIC